MFQPQVSHVQSWDVSQNWSSEQILGLTYDLSSVKLQILLDCFQSHHLESFIISSIKGTNDFVTKPSFLLLPTNTADHGLSDCCSSTIIRVILQSEAPYYCRQKKIPPNSHPLTVPASHLSSQLGAVYTHSLVTRHKSHRGSACPASTTKIQHPLFVSYFLPHSASSLAPGKHEGFKKSIWVWHIVILLGNKSETTGYN